MTNPDLERVKLLLRCAKLDSNVRLAVEVAQLACMTLADLGSDGPNLNPKDFAELASEGLDVIARIKRELAET